MWQGVSATERWNPAEKDKWVSRALQLVGQATEENQAVKRSDTKKDDVSILAPSAHSQERSGIHWRRLMELR